MALVPTQCRPLGSTALRPVRAGQSAEAESASVGSDALARLARRSRSIHSHKAPRHIGPNGSLKRDFFLRAARPVLLHVASPPSPQQQRDQEQLRSADSTPPSATPALVDVGEIEGLLPLHAQDASAVDESPPPPLSPSGPAFWDLPISSALGAMESVLSFAQNLSFLPARDLDLSRPNVAQSSSTRVSRPPLLDSQSVARRQALREELETLEAMLRPKCPWPQAQPGLEDADDVPLRAEPKQHEEAGEIPTEAAVALEAAVGPRCQWPRQVRVPTLQAPLSEYARCAWPRQIRPVAVAARAAVDAPATEDAANVASLLDAVGTREQPQTVMYPRCAWPKAGAAAQTAAPLLSAPSSHAMGPRCAWPSSKQAILVGSAESSLVLGTGTTLEVVAARCAWPRAAPSAALQPLPLHASEPKHVAGPRCAWPRNVAPVPSLAAAVPAPRCPWPRQNAAVSAAVSEASTTPLGATVHGPRCPWPRNVATSIPSPSAHAPVAAAGPRCAWPRNAAARTQSVVAEEGPSSEGPRCAWPRKVAAAVQETVQEGPRCSWPRAVKQATEAVPAPAEADTSSPEGALFERAPEGFLVQQVLPLVAMAAADFPCSALGTMQQEAEGVAPPVTEAGPRCAWPRKAAQQSGVREEVRDVPPAQAGPRCPWPRSI